MVCIDAKCSTRVVCLILFFVLSLTSCFPQDAQNSELTSTKLTEQTPSNATSAPTSTVPSSEEQIAQEATELLEAGGDVVLPNGLTDMYRLGDLLAAASPTAQPITSITIPNSYVYLTLGSGCEGLETVENLYVQENNPHYRSVDGVLFSLDGETLILFPPGRTGAYTVPDGLKYIGGRAFEYSRLTELYLSDSVERLGMYACDLMESLREISLPRGFVGGLDGCLPHTPSDPQNGQPNAANLLRENVSVVYRGMAVEWDNVSFSDIIIPPNQVILVNETT